MIYLIGGPPRCGKSTTSKELVKRLGISRIPTDIIDNMLKLYILEVDLPNMYPKDELRKVTGGGNEALYNTQSAEKILSTYLGQAKAVYPALDELFNYYIGYEEDVVVEGFHLLPSFVTESIEKYGRENFRIVYLVKEDEQEIVQGILDDKNKFDWVKDNSERPDIYPKIAQMISLYSRGIATEAEKRNFKVIYHENCFETQIEQAVNYLINSEGVIG